jgi:hypothetical protein
VTLVDTKSDEMVDVIRVGDESDAPRNAAVNWTPTRIHVAHYEFVNEVLGTGPGGSVIDGATDAVRRTLQTRNSREHRQRFP